VTLIRKPVYLSRRMATPEEQHPDAYTSTTLMELQAIVSELGGLRSRPPWPDDEPARTDWFVTIDRLINLATPLA